MPYLGGRPKGRYATQEVVWKENRNVMINAFMKVFPYQLRITDLEENVGIKRDRLYRHLEELKDKGHVEKVYRGSWRLKPTSYHEESVGEAVNEDWRRLSSFNINPNSNLCVMKTEVVGNADIRAVTPWSGWSGAPLTVTVFGGADKPATKAGTVELGIPVSELGIEARKRPGAAMIPTRIKRIELATFNVNSDFPSYAKIKKWP